MVNSLNQDNLDQWAIGDIYDFYTIPLKDNVFRAFIYNGSTLLTPDEFEECKSGITSLIDRVTKQAY